MSEDFQTLYEDLQIKYHTERLFDNSQNSTYLIQLYNLNSKKQKGEYLLKIKELKNENKKLNEENYVLKSTNKVHGISNQNLK